MYDESVFLLQVWCAFPICILLFQMLSSAHLVLRYLWLQLVNIVVN